MHIYKVLDTYVELPAGGHVYLEGKDARERAHNLKTTSELGVFEIVNPIQFKRGQTFAWDGVVPKSWVARLEQLDAPSDNDDGDAHKDLGGGTPSAPGAGATPAPAGFPDQAAPAKPRGRARPRG